MDEMKMIENNVQEEEQEEKRVCVQCGRVIEEGDDYAIDCNDDIYCSDCMGDLHWCDNCEQYFPPDADMYLVHTGQYEEYWCEDCRDDAAYYCDDCGEYYDRDHVYTDDYRAICENCYDNRWYRCSDCETLICGDNVYWGSDDQPYCVDCIDEHHDRDNIHDYGYKPSPQYFATHAEHDGGNILYLGFELEAGDTSSDSADECAGEVADSHCYCKHDGSIPEYGFELVSHPHTLRAHKEHGWEETLKTMRNYGLRSHDISDCGLHVHASANFMSEKCWIALDAFLDTYKCQMIKFARRHSSWGKFASESTYRYGSRYRALNFCPGSTREFRLFKGTLKCSTFMAALEFVDAACRVAKMYNGQVPLYESLCDYIDENAELYAECKAYMEAKHIFHPGANVVAAD